MSLTSDESSPKSSDSRSEGWLESWKEIAAYLRRSVRSARRWEKEEGLPIHRHPHGKGDSVYAYKAELDAWWKTRGAEVRDSEDPDPAAATLPVQAEPAMALPASVQEPGFPENADLPKKPRTAFLLGIGLSVAVLAAVAWISHRDGPVSPTQAVLPFKAREWVLVADFENKSGQPQLDGTLEYGLERELSNSKYVNVVPRERIGDALRLMRKPLDTRVDAAIGREVCLRDGEIRALLTGRVEKIGAKYLLTAELMEPTEGALVGSVAEEAARDEDLLPAVRRISDQVRTMLGERAPSRHGDEENLPKVTTSSLRALKLYSQADTLIATGGSGPAAEDLLRQAVAEDPEFASGHIHLAWAIWDQEKPKEEAVREAETAVRLSDRATEREKYFIRGSYYCFLGQTEKAIAAYEALQTMYPDHFWAATNLEAIYDKLGRESDALRMQLRLADLRPKDFGVNFEAAWSLARLEPDLDSRARLYVNRAQALVTREIMESDSFDVAWLELFPARERWIEGDVAGALALATQFDKKLSSTPLLRKDGAFSQLGSLYVTVGRFKAAEEIYNREADPVGDLAGLALARGNRDELKRLSNAIALHNIFDRLEKASLLVRIGLIDQAERLLVESERQKASSSSYYSPGMFEAARGELAMAKGDSAEAIRQLVKCQESHPNFSQHYFLWGMETLASARALQGDLDGAIAALELASRHKRKAMSVLNGFWWERNELLLARLYLKAGRMADARRIEAELTKLVVEADHDYPILVELKHLPAAPIQSKATAALLIR